MKRAIVTGGGGLIGSAICDALIAKGWDVASFDLKENKAARHVECDVGDEKSVMAAFKALDWDRLDIIVHCAGKLPDEDLILTETPLKTWQSYMDVNLTGAFLMAREGAKRMEEGGVIINIASTRARMSEGYDFPYAATKGGIVSLSQALAIHLGPKVRVNAIAPGWISGETNLREIDHAQHPAGRVGRAEDVADAVLYLEGAGFVTGETLVVDGGMTKKMIYA